MKRYWFSHKDAERVFPKIVKAYRQKEGLFAYDGLFPEIPLPCGVEFGGKEHFNWWFFTVMMDHSVKSMLHYERSRKLYEEIFKGRERNVFDPREVASLDVVLVYDTLSRMCFGANNHPRKFKQNATRLLVDYDGNPKNIFTGIHEVGKAKETLMTFDRFADGMAGLYLTFLIQYNLIQHFENPAELIVKVDHHDIRGLHALGVLRLEENEISDGEIAVPAAQFMREKCKELGISILDLDDALWALGVHGCAYRDPERCYLACPFDDDCKKQNMLGSYYEDGSMREGDFWKDIETKRGQELLPFEKELLQPRGLKLITIGLSKKRLDMPAEQLGLFENERRK